MEGGRREGEEVEVSQPLSVDVELEQWRDK